MHKPLHIISGCSCLLCAMLLALAYYWQWQLYLHPCPLCLIQRFLFVLLGILFFISWCHRNKQLITWRYYGSGVIFIASIGIMTSARQVWLQLLPADQQRTCGASLDYMLAHFPWHQILLNLLNGSGDCAKVVMRIMGLSMAQWSLGFFSIFLIIGLLFVLHKVNQQSAPN